MNSRSFVLLSFSVKDATSLRLDRGANLIPRFIDVIGQFSRTETPRETTIYTLTAINSEGSVTRNVTVKVMNTGQ
jgi:hypothetical protein